jgi:hypothetical protein
MNSYHIETEVEINAGPERVWRILMDFASYPEWNPFIRFMQGKAEKGARLEVKLQPGGARAMNFHPTVLSAEKGWEFRWLGHLLAPGVFDGEHSFVIEPIAGGKVRFRQSENFRGILVPLLKNSLDKDTRRGFEEMNLALKGRAEAQRP